MVPMPITKNALRTRRECATDSLHQVHDLEGTKVPFLMHDDTEKADVISAARRGNIPRLELYVIKDLARRGVHTSSDAELEVGVWVAQHAAVMCDCIRNTLWATLKLHNVAQLGICIVSYDQPLNGTSTQPTQQLSVSL